MTVPTAIPNGTKLAFISFRYLTLAKFMTRFFHHGEFLGSAFENTRFSSSSSIRDNEQGVGWGLETDMSNPAQGIDKTDAMHGHVLLL